MIEVGTVISALSVLIAFLALLLSQKASRQREDRVRADSASQLTRIEMTLESVRGGVDDIRVELRTQQQKIGEMTERVARLEAMSKTVQRRIEIIEGGAGNERDCKECN